MHVAVPYETLRSIRLSTWATFFRAAGYAAGARAAAASHAEVEAALWGVDLETGCARGLFFVAAFACEQARTDLYAAAAALGHDASGVPWDGATSPADLALALFAAAGEDDASAEVLAGAEVLRDRTFRPRTTLLYIGDPDVGAQVGAPDALAEAIGAAVARWAPSFGFGQVVSSRARRDDAGAIHFEIVHEDRRLTIVTADETRTARPLRSHALAYDPRTRRLWTATDCLEAATPLARIAGEALFGRERHFLDAPAVDVWKLQELGAAALEVPEVAAKAKVSAIGGTWHSGKHHAMTPRGRDLFKALARYKIRIEGGRLDLVTVRAQLLAPEGAPPQCDAAIRPPHQVTLSEPEHAALMGTLLDRAKITQPDPRPRDFFSMQPWIEGHPEWVASEGEEGFAALVEAGILVADRANRSVAPPDHPHAGRTATAYPLRVRGARGSKFLAWSPDPAIAPFVVTEESLVSYALSFAKLAPYVAKMLGLDGHAAKLDDDGVLFLGRRTLGPTFVLVFLLTRPIRPATVERLRDAAGHGHAILILPEGRAQRHGLKEVAMPKLSATWRPLLGGMVRALRLESLVDTTLYAPEGTRIVLHRATMRVWIDGVPCVAFHEIQFRVLEVLIAHGDQLVHTKDIAVHIAGERWTEDTTRRAIDSLATAITKSFALEGKKAPTGMKALVTMPKHGYYRLNASGFVD